MVDGIIIKCITCLVLVYFLSVNDVTAAESKCANFNTTTCDTCLNNDGCYWCAKTKTCHEFSFLPEECAATHWYLGTCGLAGLWLIIVLPSIGVVLIVIILICCYCYCCKRSNSEEEKYILAPSHRQKEKANRRSLYETQYQDRRTDNSNKFQMKNTKYGLYNDSSSNPSFDKW